MTWRAWLLVVLLLPGVASILVSVLFPPRDK
jgi:hypothetical protein